MNLSDERPFRDPFGPKGYPCGGIPCRTAFKSYRDGLEDGRDWDRFYPNNDYVPCGPYVCDNRRPGHDPDWDAYCAATVENNLAWRNGWAEGRRQALEQLEEYERMLSLLPPLEGILS